MSTAENNDQTVVTVVIAVIIVAILASVIGFAVVKSRTKAVAVPPHIATPVAEPADAQAVTPAAAASDAAAPAGK